MKFGELEKIIKADGWRLVKTKGSHCHYKHSTKLGKVTIACHPGDLSKKDVESVLKQAGLKTRSSP
jgi:predicted RNA binding protein YcfA (HicA-like mRNA interferase family)